MNQSNNAVEQQLDQSKLPTQLRAVLRIVTADEELKQKALPFVNIQRREIDWQSIFRHDLSSGHRAALIFAKICWLDEMPLKADPFDRAFSMDQRLRVAVLEALSIRWNINQREE
jgi:hypothetical protein